jgi:hypothetical protein
MVGRYTRSTISTKKFSAGGNAAAVVEALPAGYAGWIITTAQMVQKLLWYLMLAGFCL